ncbi:thioesterase family protein [Streptococcus hongkongensis]|nr:diaminopimelate epimerase [Streptococcus uberis]
MTIYSKSYETKPEHSAKTVGSGSLDVLSTPSLAAFMENTAYQFVQASIANNYSTVGTELSIQHLAPSKIGQTITIIITALKEEGRRYDFRIEAFAGKKLIAKAGHTRVRVEVQKFLEKL